MQTTYTANKIFTGEEWLTNSTIIVEGGMVKEIKTVDKKEATPAKNPAYDIIVPAFIDLQIYGAAKKLFAVYPTTEALQLLYNYCKDGGAPMFQPTVATNTPEVFYACIDAVKEYWKSGGKGVLGLHLEGPWINPVKRGAHIENLIHAPSIEEVKEMLAYGKGVISMITIAPEVCSEEVIDLIQSNKIVISAGHSNATFEQATKAFEKIKAVTHLYNAMSPLQHRSPGLVGATFTHPEVKSSIIPDGYHVDFAAVTIASKLMKGRLFAITDAVTETAEGAYPHQLAGDKYESNNILSGSALTMHKAFYNLVKHAGVEMEEALKMCSLYPAQVMGMDDDYGRIAPGSAAQFVVLNNSLELVDVII